MQCTRYDWLAVAYTTMRENAVGLEHMLSAAGLQSRCVECNTLRPITVGWSSAVTSHLTYGGQGWPVEVVVTWCYMLISAKVSQADALMSCLEQLPCHC